MIKKIRNLFLIFAILLLLFLSGCLGSEKPSDPEKQYWEHIDESDKLGEQGVKLADEADKSGDPLVQNKLLKQEKKLYEEALEEERIALSLTSDPDKKLYAEYRITSKNYLIKAVDNLIFITETDSFEEADAAAEYANNLSVGIQWAKKTGAIIPRRD